MRIGCVDNRDSIKWERAKQNVIEGTMPVWEGVRDATGESEGWRTLREGLGEGLGGGGGAEFTVKFMVRFPLLTIPLVTIDALCAAELASLLSEWVAEALLNTLTVDLREENKNEARGGGRWRKGTYSRWVVGTSPSTSSASSFWPEPSPVGCTDSVLFMTK